MICLSTTYFRYLIPPYAPSDPNPGHGETDVDIDADLSWNCSDPDGGTLTYDIYMGTSSPPPIIASNHTTNTFNPALTYGTKYYWKIIAWDNRGASNESPIWNFTTVINNPPDTPSQPSGPLAGRVGEDLEYSTSTIDSEGHDLYYWFDWGNGENSGWIGPYPSGNTASAIYYLGYYMIIGIFSQISAALN